MMAAAKVQRRPDGSKYIQIQQPNLAPLEARLAALEGAPKESALHDRVANLERMVAAQAKTIERQDAELSAARDAAVASEAARVKAEAALSERVTAEIAASRASVEAALRSEVATALVKSHATVAEITAKGVSDSGAHARATTEHVDRVSHQTLASVRESEARLTDMTQRMAADMARLAAEARGPAKFTFEKDQSGKITGARREAAA